MRSPTRFLPFALALGLLTACGARSDLEPALAGSASADGGADVSHACTAHCAGKACGASDGCGGTCQATCGCGPESCANGCCQGGTCVGGTNASACGIAGNACAACSAPDVCFAGTCGPQRAVLFGGTGVGDAGAVALNDTWTWDGETWAQIDVQGPPSQDEVMASLDGRLVLLTSGGMLTSVGPTSSTWEWTGRSWTEVHVAGPVNRLGGAMAPLDGTLVLYGGCVNVFWDNGEGCVLVTATWNGSAWTELPTAAPGAIFGLMDSAMASLNGTIIMFGGARPDAMRGPVDTTWLWDGASWSIANTPGPSPRSGAAMATLAGSVVLFGGYAPSPNTNSFADTWVWDGTAWTELPVTGPAARHNAVMAAVAGKLVLFGGWSEETTFSDTWTWDGAAWTQHDVPGPSARSGAVMATP